VPQISLAAELREEDSPAEEDVLFEEFTAERAASSLAGFQRGTLQARDDGAQGQYDEEEPAVPDAPAAVPDAPAAAPSSTPLADRS
jgi:hypothetical protein